MNIRSFGNHSVFMYNEFSATDHDIYAVVVSSEGATSGEYVIANSVNQETRPTAVYNPINQQYLLLWRRWVGDIEFGNNDIYGRIANNEFTVLGDPIKIKESPENESAPTAAFIPGKNQYLVIWSDNVGMYPRLKKQWINTNGTLGTYEQYFTVGANFNPRLAANTRIEEYVYVNEEKTYSPSELTYGYVALQNSGAGFGGAIVPYWTQDQTNIVVAYNPKADNYLIAWEQTYSSIDHDIYMIIYDTFTANYCCLKIGPKVISYLSTWEGNPTVASSPYPESLVVWEDYRNQATNGVDLYFSMVVHGKQFMPIIRQ